ncbi:MAG: reductive dehalogenase [bacterium]|nr:reductive dehalogenase [bacterium]
MMGEEGTPKTSRRNFLKLGGLVGVGAQALTLPVIAYRHGKSHSTYTGWESFEGSTQYFNRKPFELQGVEELYEKFLPVKGEVERPNDLVEVSWNRAGMIRRTMENNPDWKPGDGIEALGLPPPLLDHYKHWLEKGQDRFATDVRTVTVTFPNRIANHEKYDDHTAVVNAFFGAWQENAMSYPDEIEGPPDPSDFQYKEFRQTLDLREVNAARKERGALLTFRSPNHAAELIKKVAHQYGATLVGIAKFNPDYVYTKIRGVGAMAPGGSLSPSEADKIPEHWKYVIVLGVPHEWDQLVSNPQYGDSLDAYTRVRTAGYRLTQFLKRLGYPARWHCPPASYDLVVPPYAVEAGIGQFGRMGIVISPETGGNTRLAAVTTSLEMTADKPIDFGVDDFCKDCKICAELCPSGAISFADSPDGMVVRGIEHWYIDTSKCYQYWNETLGPIGCRLCIAACPYSRKANWVHGVARVADPIDPTGMLNDTLIWMQKTFFKAPNAEAYRPPPDGCFASYRPAPPWLQTEKWFDIAPDNPQLLCK